MRIKNNIENNDGPYNSNVEYDSSYRDLWYMLAAVVFLSLLFGSMFTVLFEN